MDLNNIEEILSPYLLENNLELYSVELKKEYGFLILCVLIDKVGGINLDELSLVNKYLSARLDEVDQDMPDYMLEVSSPGAEKALRNIDEVKKSIGQYINVKTKDMVYEGYLVDIVNEVISMSINIKGRKKNIDINYADVKKIRLAVKI